MNMRQTLVLTFEGDDAKRVIIALRDAARLSRVLDVHVQDYATYTLPDPHKPVYGPARKGKKGKTKRW